MTVRTWRQGRTVMAAADADLSTETVAAAAAGALRRWSHAAGPGMLLVGTDDLGAARELAPELPELVAEVREVNGLPDAGWAIAWLAEEAAG